MPQPEAQRCKPSHPDWREETQPRAPQRSARSRAPAGPRLCGRPATRQGQGRAVEALRASQLPTASSLQVTRHTHLSHRRLLGGGSEWADTLPHALRLPKRGRQSTLDLRPRLRAPEIPQRLAADIAIGGSALGRHTRVKPEGRLTHDGRAPNPRALSGDRHSVN